MSRNTFIHTRFWQDAYISDLDPIEKLLFNYCLTNSFITLSGIYEIPLKVIAVETGIDREMLVKIFGRFEADKKIVYRDGWLCVINYPKYQSYNKTTMVIALKREISLIPNVLVKKFIGYGYPMDTLSIGYLDMDMVMDKDTDKEITTKKGKETITKDTYSVAFENFWKAYPRKIGKQLAYRVWKNKKLDSLLKEIVSAVEAQKKTAGWKKEGGQFIPHPTTWLNRGSWEDEVEETKFDKLWKQAK
jgi:hypothetical protein